MGLRGGYCVVAQALGVDDTVLCVVPQESAFDLAKWPMRLDEFTGQFTGVQAVAAIEQHYAWELAIRGALALEDVPETLRTASESGLEMTHRH